MTSHSPLPVGAIKTRVLILLIVLIVCGVAGTVIFTHILRKPDREKAATSELNENTAYHRGMACFEIHWLRLRKATA